MQSEINELESIITDRLIDLNSLKNLVAQKELEKHDQLKDVALSIIDIIDSFELVEESIKEKGLDKVESVIKMMNRYKIIKKKNLNLLQRYGITKVEFPENRLIVGLCEVLETEIDNSKKNDDIISIVRNGYIRGNELIRTAQLIVVKN